MKFTKGPNQGMMDSVINHPISNTETQRCVNHMGKSNNPPVALELRISVVRLFVLRLVPARSVCGDKLNQETNKQMGRNQAVEKTKHLQVISPELGSGNVDKNAILHVIFNNESQVTHN